MTAFKLSGEQLKVLRNAADESEGVLTTTRGIEALVNAELVADRKILVTGILEGLKESRPGLEYSIEGNKIQIRIPTE